MSENIELPKGWVTARLGEIVTANETQNPHKLGRDSFLYVDIEAVDNHTQQITSPKTLDCNDPPSRARMRLKSGDVIFSLVRPYLKNIAVVPESLDDEVASTAFCTLRPATGIRSRFLFYQIVQDSFINSIPTYGSSPPAARDNEFLQSVTFVPPTEEQGRIVEKIDELLSDLDAGVAALKRVRANLKRYRAAVLKAAVEGKLTEEWREEHTPKETGEELLTRILKERRRKWETDQLAAYEAKGAKPPQNWQARYKEPAAPDTTGLPELPQGWCWANLEGIADVTGGITKGWKRKSKTLTQEVPYLRVANVQRGFLELSEIKTINAPLEKIEALRLKSGDILFNEGGDRDKLGRGWVWKGHIDDCIHQNHVFRARLLSSDVVPELVSHHGNSFGQLWFLRTGKQSVNLASISLSVLRAFPVPIAPPEEQQEIARELEEKLSYVTDVEALVDAGLKRASRLRQSILKDAFEGTLVAQDPADEPAAELLARIDAERYATIKIPKVARRPRKVPREITHRRGALVAYMLTHSASNGQAQRKSQKLGRTKLIKALYIAQTHEELDLRYEFQRFAAGPFDEAIYKVEGTGRKNEWFTTQDRENYGVTYHPAGKTEDMCRAATEFLGSKQADMDRLLGHIDEMTMKQAELFATSYAAWNDLLIDGREVTDEAVIDEFYGWEESKKTFSRSDVQKQLQWMRTEGYIPTGKGERTQPRSKRTKLPSKRRRSGGAKEK